MISREKTWFHVICKLLAKFGFREARDLKKKFILIERIELFDT